MRVHCCAAVLLLPTTALASEAHGKVDNGARSGVPWSGYYAGVEPLAKKDWKNIISPRINQSNLHSVLEISPGGGRFSEIFRHKVRSYIGIDINAPAIEILRTQRFVNASHMQFYTNDGHSMPMVQNNSITFVFSFDSMVHFPPKAVVSYIAEIARVLRPGGTAWLHHGNLRLCTNEDKCVPLSICHFKWDSKLGYYLTLWHNRGLYAGNNSCGIPGQATKNPQARNAGTTCASVAAAAETHALEVIQQEQPLWGMPPKHVYDCYTYLRKPSAGHDHGFKRHSLWSQ